MKILDKYLVKSFLVPFGICVFIFTILVLLGRFFDKMEMFVRFHAHMKDIIVYLFLALPFWLNLVLPIATMLALLFSLGQLYQRGEFTAFRSAGIPSWRLYLPYAGIGFFLAIVSLIGGMTFLPKLNFESRRIYRVNIKGRDVLDYRKDKIVAAGRGNRRFTIGWLDVPKNQLKDVVVDRFGNNSEWVETISGKLATYQDGRWLFKDGSIRSKNPNTVDGVDEIPFNERWVDIPEKPEEFALEDKEMEDMSGHELKMRTERLQRLGAPTYKERVAWHMRLALPFANVIVIALAIPYAIKSGIQGRTQNFSYALALAFMYWGVTSVCQSFGEHGQMPAWLCAWVSNLMFSTIAIWKLSNVS